MFMLTEVFGQHILSSTWATIEVTAFPNHYSEILYTSESAAALLIPLRFSSSLHVLTIIINKTARTPIVTLFSITHTPQTSCWIHMYLVQCGNYQCSWHYFVLVIILSFNGWHTHYSFSCNNSGTSGNSGLPQVKEIHSYYIFEIQALFASAPGTAFSCDRFQLLVHIWAKRRRTL